MTQNTDYIMQLSYCGLFG